MPGECILVTGAGGFVGAAVVKAAVAAGHEVVAVVRNSTARLASAAGEAQIERIDLADTRAVDGLLASARPDIVIHCAWEGVGGGLRSSAVQLDNVRTTVALADAALAVGVRKFVGIGSQAEYGRHDRRVVETDLPRPTMLYGAAKLAAMHLASQRCRDAGADFAWLRLFAVYGAGDNGNWLIPSVAASLMRGVAPDCTAGTQKWDYLHIDDAADAILAAALTKGTTGTFNLSSGDPIEVRAIIERLRDLAAPGLKLNFGAVPFGPDQIMHLEGDSSRLRALTGWAPRVGIDEGLRQVVDQLRMAA